MNLSKTWFKITLYKSTKLQYQFLKIILAILKIETFLKLSKTCKDPTTRIQSFPSSPPFGGWKLQLLANDTRSFQPNTNDTRNLVIPRTSNFSPLGRCSLGESVCAGWKGRVVEGVDPWPMFRLGEIENRLEINGSSDGGCQIFTRRACHFHKGESFEEACSSLLSLPLSPFDRRKGIFLPRINLEGFAWDERDFEGIDRIFHLSRLRSREGNPFREIKGYKKWSFKLL